MKDKVLPKWAGLAKLLSEGSIERIPGEGRPLFVRQKNGGMMTFSGIEHVINNDPNAVVEVIDGGGGFKL